jgi:hypothetical protein
MVVTAAAITATFSGLPIEILSHYFGKIADALGAELTSDLDWKVWKAKHGLANNNSDFPERYAEALLSLKAAHKPQPLLKFFANESVFAVIHDYWYGETDTASFEKDFANLTRHFTLDEQLEAFSAHSEISFFLNFYRKSVNLNRSAGEREEFELLLQILKEVRAEKNRHRPAYEGLIDRIDKNFLQAEKEKTGPLITPEGFYLANGPAQWWGVMNGLVAPKTLYHDLPERVQRTFYATAPVLALLDGSGGMGKTTAARLLVTELCERYECWWVDELGGEELDAAMPEFLESRVQSGRETLVVLDDWGKYSEGCRRTLIQFMRRQANKGHAANLRFVVTAKPDEHSDLSHDHILLARDAEVSFDAAEHLKTDNENLLKRALSRLPEELKGLYETLFNPQDRLLGKPFHLLFILLRAAQDPELRQRLTQHNAEGKFKQVMQYDFDQLYRDDERRGLAVAMLFFAYVKHKHRSSLPYEAFLALANQYATGKTPPGQRLATQTPEQWHIINHYLTKGKRDGDKRLDAPEFIQFKKDEYPEYLLQINLKKGQSAAEYLEQEKKLMVQFLIEHGGGWAASQLAHIFSQKEPLLSEEEQIATVEALLSRSIGHHGYTSIFLMPNALPSIPFEQKWAWIKRFNEFAPNNQAFHQLFLKFILQEKKKDCFEYLSALINLGANSQDIWFIFLNHAPPQIRDLEAKRLLKVENQDPQVIWRCLDLLRDEAKDDARRLLKVEGQHPFVVRRCLDLLGGEAKDDARRLLKVEGQHPFVVRRCLDLLGGEAKDDARRLLKVENQAKVVICRCLQILKTQDPDWEVAQDYCLGILENWQKAHPMLVGNCLNYLPQHPLAIQVMQVAIREKYNYSILYGYIMQYGYGQHDFWKQEVRRVIQNWRKERQIVVGSCLVHLESEPSLVYVCCKGILQDWESEYAKTKQALAKKKRTNDRYLQKALAHQQLRPLAAATAQAMYAREQAEPGFLLYHTCEMVYGIVERGEWPAWESANEAEE